MTAQESDPVATLHASKAAFARLLGSLPGASLHEHPEAAWVDTGVPDGMFNGVYRLSGDPAAAASRVAAHFEARGLPFHWEVGLRGEAPDTAATLVGHGLRHDEDEPGMWLDLAAAPVAVPPVDGLTVRPVVNPELLEQWVRVWGCGAPPAATDRFLRVYAALPYGPAGPLRMFVGFLGDRPVATVYVFLAAGVAAVHFVVTLPELRRRGIGTAMTGAALGEARAAGYRIAVLTASPDGEGIYRRLGFQRCCVVSTYGWQPDDLAIEPLGADEPVDIDELVALYGSVGWSAYTREPEMLRAAIAGSSFVVTARRGTRLVGLARAISDGVTDCYLQDVLVVPDQQRAGVGRALVGAVMERYAGVRRKLLLTGDEPRQQAFYDSLGYTDIRDVRGGPIRAFVRFDGWGAT